MDRIFAVGIKGEPPITVRPHPDAPNESVLLCTKSAEDIEHWGPLNLWLPAELAIALGNALIEAASKLEQQR